MAHHDEEYDDNIMLSESLESIASQAMELKKKIEAGLQLPSWAEYKVYQAYDGVNKALGTAYPGRYEMGADKKASVFNFAKQAAAPKFSPAMDTHPALKGGQSKLPDKIQAGIIKKKMGEKKASAFDLVKEAFSFRAPKKERELIGHFKLPIYDGDPGDPGAKVVDHFMHPVFKNEPPGITLGPDTEWVPLAKSATEKKASVFDLVRAR